ncbi:hypothetical protein [Sinosporangium siamense]|uniref:Thioredoxin domain-containing protein n=1 Tax=Sinosporangium siamense TaxID=1367973 RepID=A0A919RL53_9ACTN|nr:hypothetical protein [Sinosporangium siamense]GII95827.1 hypothetical protein Ssi02_60580 [Sinosporangium siamense]
MTFLWMLVAAISMLTVIAVLALADQYRTLEQVRAKLKLEDNPTPIPLPQEGSLAPSDVGLPAELDVQEHLVVLFLSTSCTTCRSVADGLRSVSTTSVWVVVEHAHSVEEGLAWLAPSEISADRVVVDLDGRVAGSLGISVTPSVVLYRSGEALLARTVPSFRQLAPLLSARRLLRSLKSTRGGMVRL